jgi:hypothetical protein
MEASLIKYRPRHLDPKTLCQAPCAFRLATKGPSVTSKKVYSN